MFTLKKQICCMTFFKNKAAFTLAEVLITLAIIGVVAAMTLPTLILKHQKQQWVTGLQNAYSTISNGLNLMKTQEGVDNLYDTEFFHGDCMLIPHDDDTRKACFNKLKQYINIVDYKDWSPLNYPMPAYILNNGIKLVFFPGLIFVDVNGDKKPNKTGRDIFAIQYFDNGKVIGNPFPDYDIDYIMMMYDDIYRQFYFLEQDGGEICSMGVLGDNGIRVCGWHAFDDERQNALALQQRCGGCDDYDGLWSCYQEYATKVCPDKHGDDYDYYEGDYGLGCTAKIMADGWKMNY